KREALFRAWNRVTDIVLTEPERAWELLELLVEQAPTDAALGYVAAGPLEDFLVHHGRRFLGELEKRASRSAKFRLALGGVWSQGRMAPDVMDAIGRVVGRKLKTQ